MWPPPPNWQHGVSYKLSEKLMTVLAPSQCALRLKKKLKITALDWSGAVSGSSSLELELDFENKGYTYTGGKGGVCVWSLQSFCRTSVLKERGGRVRKLGAPNSSSGTGALGCKVYRLLVQVFVSDPLLAVTIGNTNTLLLSSHRALRFRWTTSSACTRCSWMSHAPLSIWKSTRMPSCSTNSVRCGWLSGLSPGHLGQFYVLLKRRTLLAKNTRTAWKSRGQSPWLLTNSSWIL